MINKKIKLFSCCLPVKGINRGIVIDFKRKIFHVFSNEIIDVVDEYSNKSIYTIFQDFKKSKSILKKYINYFVENEIVVISNETENFIDISTEFLKPFELDTVTLELDKNAAKYLIPLNEQLDLLGISCLKVILKRNNIGTLQKLLAIISNSKIQTITLFVEHETDIETDIAPIKNGQPRINEIIYYNVENSSRDISLDLPNIYYENGTIQEVFFKKINSAENFVLEHEYYIESLNFNSVYNRSIFIDAQGNIKRYLDDKSIYGNVLKEEIAAIIENQDFTSFWKITKDQIKTCKDCEFRYVCPDGRIPEKSTEINQYTHETKCIYDPYKNVWN